MRVLKKLDNKREALAKKQGLRKKVVEEKKKEDEEGDDGTQGAPP